MINTKEYFEEMIGYVILIFTTYFIIKDFLPDMNTTMHLFWAGVFDVLTLGIFFMAFSKIKGKERKKLKESERL